jgi:N-methylhydantoinase A
VDSQFIIGIDVGGTFTDVICVDKSTGDILSAKVSSHPGEQWKGVLESLSRLGIAAAEIDVFAHGTTIATNTLLERKGARAAFLTTSGFRDTLEIGKTRRLVGGLFDTRFVRPKPLVGRPYRIEVDERIDAAGEILRPLHHADLDHAIELIGEHEIEAVAIGFVNSYINDQHEVEAVQYLRSRLPDSVLVFSSTELTREKGEFERFSTVALNAYLAPSLSYYLDRLQAHLADASFDAPINVMSSNGGYMTIARARRAAIRTFLSGPVGGVIGAQRLSAQSAIHDFITFDMGGTSTDVALCKGALPSVSYDNLIEAYPSRIAQLDIHTIGAGGGSIAHRGGDGGLYVGPHSAGANPGPAAYQRGGTLPTVTDANVLLGRLPASNTLGGNVQLSHTAALRAFMGLTGSDDPSEAVNMAHSVLRIATLKMAGAVQEVTVHRGYDPRDFHLVGFGGAGPMHVFLVAEELGVTRVLIPRSPGHVSAYGQILADAVHHFVHPFAPTTLDVVELRAGAKELRVRAAAQFAEDGFSTDAIVVGITAETRYRGQSFTIEIPIRNDDFRPETIASDFHAAHLHKFGHRALESTIEITALRATASIQRPFIPEGPDLSDREAVPTKTVPVYWNEWIPTPIYTRNALATGTTVTGPAIIEEDGATTVVPGGWIVTRDAAGHLDCIYSPAQTETRKAS